MAKVVEYRSYHPGAGTVAWTRFVLVDPSGPVRVVPLRENGDSIWRKPGWDGGIPGPGGKMLRPEDGRAFLEQLPNVFHGSSLAATGVFDMADALALAPVDHGPAIDPLRDERGVE